MKFVNSISVTFIFKDSSTSNCIAESAPPALDVSTSAAAAPPSVPAVPTTATETGLASSNVSTSSNSSKVSCQICGKVLANKKILITICIRFIDRSVAFDG